MQAIFCSCVLLWIDIDPLSFKVFSIIIGCMMYVSPQHCLGMLRGKWMTGWMGVFSSPLSSFIRRTPPYYSLPGFFLLNWVFASTAAWLKVWLSAKQLLIYSWLKPACRCLQRHCFKLINHVIISPVCVCLCLLRRTPLVPKINLLR